MRFVFAFFAVFSCFAALAMPPVVYPKNAPRYEYTAARQLAEYLNRIAPQEASVPLVDSACEPAFFVGKTPEALKAFGLKSWDELAMDEVLYRVDDRGNVWIAGEGERGSTYAVYEFLEREYGVRFFADDFEVVPTQDPFRLPEKGTSYRYAPPFMVRAIYYQQLLYTRDVAFQFKMRHNFSGWDHPDWGRKEAFIHFVHTFEILIPSEKYFKEHPEWFAFRDGQRQNQGEKGQLCLTNKGMRRELVKNALAACEAHPECHLISISQNDNFNYCQCEQCESFVKEHGEQSDLLLDCVNEVADAIAAKYPHVLVDTLAYQYTRQPPKSIMPHANVVIRFCTIEARQLFALNAPQNADIFNELQSWRKVAPKMLIWNYLTNFQHYPTIHPNWANIAPDIRLFRDCHAVNVLEQGPYNHCGKAADLSDLRIYLVSKLLWNPDLDEKAIVKEFCDNYYGRGAHYIYEYLDTVTQAAKNHPENTDDCFHTAADHYFTPEELAKLWSNIFAGAKEFRHDTVYGTRFAIAALPATMALLEHPELFQKPDAERLEVLRGVDAMELLSWCCRVFPVAGLDHTYEHGAPVQLWVDKVIALHQKAAEPALETK